MKAKILYVDDEPINLQLFELNFSKKYEVFIANDGFQGLELLDKELEICLVISDMKMPEMNGIEFIKKAKEKYPSKKFCIMTGFEITEEISDALSSGLIFQYFRKPFRAKELEIAIDKGINS